MTETPSGGHNSVAGERLRSLVERIERLEEERKALGSDISDIFKEAKSSGLDVPALRQVLKARKLDPTERKTRDSLVELYARALGM